MLLETRSEATLRRSRRRRSRRRRVAAAATLDREEPGESEDEEVKRADGHLGRDEQIETRAFPQQYDEVPDESSSVLQLSPREFRKHGTK